VRHGLAIETLDGETAVLASTRFRVGPRVGRYRVDVEALDRVAIPAIAPRADIQLMVVDEIGKMEVLSPRFRDTVRDALDASTSILATVAQTGGGFIAEVRRRPDVTLLVMRSAERDAMPARLGERLRALSRTP